MSEQDDVILLKAGIDLGDFEKDEKKVKDMLTQLRAEVSKTGAEFMELQTNQREGAKSSVDLEKRIKTLSGEFDNNRTKVASSSKGVIDYIKNLNILGFSVGDTIDKVKSGGEGFLGFARNVTTARGALIALTAVPIIAVLAAVIAFFKSTDEGADRLEQGLAGLRAGFDAVFKTIAPLGKLLIDTFLNPIDAIKKFGSALLNPIDSLKAIIKGSKDMAVGVAKNFTDAANAAITYTRQMQNIEDAENGLIKQRAKVGLQVDQALLKVKDRNLSERQRINILKEAGKAEEALAKQQLIIARDRLAATYQQNIAIQRSRKLTDDELKKQLEAEAAVISAKRDTLNTQQAITNRLSALNEQEAASRKESLQKQKEAQKQAAQERVYEAEAALIQAKRKGEETLSLEENLIQKQGELEKVGLSKNSAQRRLIDAQTNAAVLATRAAHLAELAGLEAEAAKNRLNAQLLLVRKGSDEERKLRQQLLDDQLLRDKSAAVDAANQNVALRAGLTKRLRLIDANYNADSEALDLSYKQAEINRTAELGKLRIQTELDLSEDVTAIRRNLATETINLEEQQQLALLKLQDIGEAERLVRQNAIEANAIKLRKQVYQQILADRRADQRAQLETELVDIGGRGKRELEIRHGLLQLQRADELANTELGEEQKALIRAKYRKAERDLDKAYFQSVFDTIVTVSQQATATLSTIIEAQAQAATNSLTAQQEAAVKSAGTNADLRAKIEERFQKDKLELEKFYAEKRRKIAIAENIIGTARGVVEAFKSPFPLNLIQAALVVATGVAQTALIREQKFAKGTVLNGPSHANGGIQLFSRTGHHYGEAEGDEIILTKGVYRNPTLRAQASALNVAGGGIPLTNIREVPQLRSFEHGGLPQPAQPQDLGQIVEAIQSLNIFVSVTDIDNVKGDMTKAKASGSY